MSLPQKSSESHVEWKSINYKIKTHALNLLQNPHGEESNLWVRTILVPQCSINQPLPRIFQFKKPFFPFCPPRLEEIGGERKTGNWLSGYFGAKQGNLIPISQLTSSPLIELFDGIIQFVPPQLWNSSRRHESPETLSNPLSSWRCETKDISWPPSHHPESNFIATLSILYHTICGCRCFSPKLPRNQKHHKIRRISFAIHLPIHLLCVCSCPPPAKFDWIGVECVDRLPKAPVVPRPLSRSSEASGEIIGRSKHEIDGNLLH